MSHLKIIHFFCI